MYRCFQLLVLSSAVLVAGSAIGSAAKPNIQPIELFTAIEAGDVEVRLIPKDATRATVIFKNVTDRHVHLDLPEAFAGIPQKDLANKLGNVPRPDLAKGNLGVLAQIGGRGGLGGGGRGGLGGGGNQGIGGGFGGGGRGGGGFGGGFFSVPPDSVRKVKVATVCLEHGKKDPNPKVAYVIQPIEKITKDRKVVDIIRLLSVGRLDQVSAQAAAWHLTDQMSWAELANKVKIQHLNGSRTMFFNQGQINLALRAVAYVEEIEQNARGKANGYPELGDTANAYFKSVQATPSGDSAK